MGGLRASDGTVGGSPQNVKQGGLELQAELKWVAGGWAAFKRVKNGLEC